MKQKWVVVGSLMASLLLGGCGLSIPMAFSIVGAGVEVADKVVGLDVSLTQSMPNKVPLAKTLMLPVQPAVIVPSAPAPAPVYEPIRTMAPVWSPGDPR